MKFIPDHVHELSPGGGRDFAIEKNFAVHLVEVASVLGKERLLLYYGNFVETVCILIGH